MKTSSFVTALLLAAALGSPAVVHAGRGSSPTAIQNAIRSNSTDAICAELERAEHLVCGSCVKMVQPLLDHDDARVRQVAAWWMARRGRSELFVDMAKRLAQPDSRLARNAADVLGELRMTKAVTPLSAGLQNPLFDAEARSAMARALGRLGDRSGLPALERALDAQEAPVRQAALQGLREIDGFSDPATAAARLADPDEQVRAEAVYTVAFPRRRALLSNDAGRIVQALLERVSSDPSPVVRRRAAWALGEIGAPGTLAGPALSRAATQDEDPFVRTLAQAAATRLGP